ncbi:IPTL-CTERM sorting domain-containing protein [Elongatibacter sediminis]|uniref:IPTL-CTERM sorting domain-containing protein n=1 Tax=Elongatibacter sediminis TaxID=3119006 RepID=A0AAW9RFJ9_9GAMM
MRFIKIQCAALLGLMMLALIPATALAQESRITAISNPTVTEGDAGTTNVQFEITCQCDLAVSATVQWQLNDGTATAADNDYNDTSGNFQVNGGSGVETYFVNVTVNGDTTPEPDETFELELTSASVGSPSFFIDDDTGVATIENDDVDADISLISSESIDPVVAGSGAGNLTYVVTAGNSGVDATGVAASVTVMWPAGVTVDSVTPSGSGTWSGTWPGTWTIGNLANGANETLTVVLTAGPSAEVSTDAISLSANVSALDQTETNTGNNSTAQQTSIAREVDIEVTKTESIDAVVAGSGDDNLTYTITVTNSGFSDVTDLVINDSTTLPANVTIDSVTPSSGSWVAPNWTVSIPAGGTETLTVVLDVPLTADEGTDVVSNTASVTGSGGGETIVNSSNDSATQATSIRWPEASFDVMKEYTSGDGGPVNVTLECSDTSGLLVYAPQQGSTTTTLTVRRFDIDPASAGTSCTVVEDVPDGFAEAARSADCDVDPTADNFDSDPYACTITNTPTRATFEVQKRYMDGNNDVPVTLNLSCNTGLPLDQSRTVFPDNEGNFGNGQFEVKFVVESYTDGELDCTVTEEPAPGYSGSYNCAGNANTDCDVGDPSGIPNDNFFEGPCVWEDITADGENGAEMKCVIRNYPDPVDVVIEKDFVLEGNPSGVDTDYDLTLYCSGEIIGGYNLDENVESPAGKPGPGCGLFKPVQESGQGIIVVQPEWCKSFSGSAPDLYEAQVIPEYPYSECYVIERVYDSAIEVDNDCFGLQVSAGQGASCTVTNTIFFEGIPTLNQYGMALLALLMLGMGFIGFRRFA